MGGSKWIAGDGEVEIRAAGATGNFSMGSELSVAEEKVIFTPRDPSFHNVVEGNQHFSFIPSPIPLAGR